MISQKRQRLYKELKSAITQELKRRAILQEQFDWSKHARSNQLLPEGDWRCWLILAGRGFGKTRTGAEAIREWVKTGTYKRIALIAETQGEARKVMVEGDSGILSVSPGDERPHYSPSKRLLTWPNGATAHLYGGNHYEQLRGPQFDAAWVDELAKFKYPQEAWEQLMLGLRLGKDPRVIVTTTPRSVPFLKEFMKDPGTVITHGTTFENADNLAPGFLQHMRTRFEGTRLGMQELMAEFLSDTEGALWTETLLKPARVTSFPDFKRIVVAIDPAMTHGDQSDETGVIVAALGEDNKGYILEDLSGKHSPGEWARLAVAAYWRHEADRIVAEVNKGGDLVERVVRSYDPQVSYKAVRATRGKATRAEPVVALYEQGRVKHISRNLETLESQMVSYLPGKTSKSPDRIDALVWALTELMLEGEAASPRVWLS